jgi:poly(A) polymerase
VRPKIYTQEEHRIEPINLDPDALDVIFRLKHAGFTAYVVGGGVRDLLLGQRPKDFDISTSAKPEEIKQLFGKKCLLIGRRFRLAHLRFGPKVLEVATFRAGENTSSLILRDNRWGSPEEDVLRRDFTINSLFYDPTTHVILDYVGGYQDLEHKLLRTIGDPYVRFKQDPVRMIRLLKFRARFNFDCDQKTAKALNGCKEEIVKSSPARILEELFKMLESGHAAEFFALMLTHEFLEILFPCFYHFFAGPNAPHGFDYLKAIDAIDPDRKKRLDRALFFSALVYPILEQELLTLSQDRQAPISLSEIVRLAHALLRGISTSSFSHFPRRILALSHSIIVNQFRLTPLKGRPKIGQRFGDDEEFHLALEFLRVRSTLDARFHQVYLNWRKKETPS